MPLQVSYMGTKRSIAPQVAAVIAKGPPGPLLDLFSGICAIGSAVSPSRQIWCNDVQVFASTVARAFFASPGPPIHFDLAAEIARRPYLENRHALEKRFAHALKKEREAFQSGDVQQISDLEDVAPNVTTSRYLQRERARLAKMPAEAPWRLFTITFSGGYLGIGQCIQVDSIRYAVDQLRSHGQLDQHQHTWLCLALCQALSKVATTTGHFAQYMRVKEATLGRFLAQRRRSVWSEWLRAIFESTPVGTRAWRSNNKVFRDDAVKLLSKLRKKNERPAVVYADPPYTSDHYSRYYHIYETLLLYDYPRSEGVGRYRPDRFVSPYSVKAEVETTMDALISGCAKLGARLVLSYPDGGLLPDACQAITAMIKKHFGSDPIVSQLDHVHSSMGGSKGHEKYRVKELIFAAD